MNNDTVYPRPRVVADYIWNVTLALPIVMAFVPGLWPLAWRGFVSLHQAPGWYQLAVEAAIAFAFGTKTIAAGVQAFAAAKGAGNDPASGAVPEANKET